jgi:hypothetical protein
MSMANPRHILPFAPTAPGVGDGLAVFFFSGYRSADPVDHLMRLREIPHLADDIASLRAAGYTVIYVLSGDARGLGQALESQHPAAPGLTTVGLLWNGHGGQDGGLTGADGSWITPGELPAAIAQRASCRLLVLAACHAAGQASLWTTALGPQARIVGWTRPVTVDEGIAFFSPDEARQDDLDDLLRELLGAPNLGPGPHPELAEILQLDREHADHFSINPLALPAGSIAVGDVVLAQWRSGWYFPATLTRHDGQRFLATWHDGDAPSWVQPYQIRPLGSPTEPDLPGYPRVGMRLRARWTDGHLYQARLIDREVRDGVEVFLVAWEDGDRPLWLPLDGLELPAKERPVLEIGMQVLARWRDGSFYPAQIAEQDGPLWLVRWADGDQPLWLGEEMIALAPSA